MHVDVQWPAHWQPEAIAAVSPYLGQDERVDILVGDPVTSVSGTRLSGYLYRGDDGSPMIIFERSGRPDVYPWRLLAGPVLSIELLRPGRRRLQLYRHPRWTR